ncbi:N-acetylglucosaminyl-phosphatidylinositol de-N-acetylase [Collariella sp. IMI 366227]|nr:N-acetylglucosaminyl-phosphatidylinositol de-N-acetylase [Collariella sp. IMI 366227]
MDWLTTLGVLAVVLPSLYIYTASVVSTRFPILRNKRICLLIAHPDDEAMFFAPTVMALARNADGLGPIRKAELAKSGLILGLRKPDDVYVVDKPEQFPDSMTATWDPAAISSLLCSAFAPGLARSRNGNTTATTTGSSATTTSSNPTTLPTASIDILITFDSSGVSHHPNHISLYHGARAFVSALVANNPGWVSPVDLYTLTTVPMARKYMGFLDVLATLISWAAGADKKNKRHPGGLVFLNGLAGGQGGITTAWSAMVKAHRSQMVWFRYGWIGLSRYMYVNDLRLEKVRGR